MDDQARKIGYHFYNRLLDLSRGVNLSDASSLCANTYDEIAKYCKDCINYEDTLNTSLLLLGYKVHTIVILSSLFPKIRRGSNIENDYSKFLEIAKDHINKNNTRKQIVGNYFKYIQQFSPDRAQDFIMYEIAVHAITIYIYHRALIKLAESITSDEVIMLSRLDLDDGFDIGIAISRTLGNVSKDIAKKYMLVTDFDSFNYDIGCHGSGIN